MKKKELKKLESIDKEAMVKQDTYNGSQLVERFIDNKTLLIRDKDSSGVYSYSDNDKLFIQAYFMSGGDTYILSQVLDMDETDVLKKLYNVYINEEIKRLQKEMNVLRMSQKIMTLDEMQSYLTSWILDENFYGGEKLNNSDKLKAFKLLEELKIIKANQSDNSYSVLESLPNQDKLENLSVDAIKLLLETNSEKEQKEKIINELIKINPNLNKDDLLKKSNDELNKMKSKTKKGIKQNDKKQTKRDATKKK